MVNIAQHIQAELAKREETMNEFLARTRLPKMTVYRAIRGETLRPKTKGRIANALKKPVDELFPPAPSPSNGQAQANEDQAAVDPGNQSPPRRPKGRRSK